MGTWRYGMRLDFDSNLAIQGISTATASQREALWPMVAMENHSGTSNSTTPVRWSCATSPPATGEHPHAAEAGESLRLPLLGCDDRSVAATAASGTDRNHSGGTKRSRPPAICLTCAIPKSTCDPTSMPTATRRSACRTPANSQYIWNVLDIDPLTGHIGVGNTGVASDPAEGVRQLHRYQHQSCHGGHPAPTGCASSTRARGGRRALLRRRAGPTGERAGGGCVLDPCWWGPPLPNRMSSS